MKKLQEYKKKAVVQYDDLRDTVAVIEAMNFLGNKPGMHWENLKRKLHAKHN